MISPNGHDRGGAHPKGKGRIIALEGHAHREALRQPDPVERLFDFGKTLHGRTIVLIERPSDALHPSTKSFVWIAQQINLRRHAGADVAEEILAEIREHIPGSIVDQT